ncbi:Gfo/Idh/MocA family protein [Dictyobacter kobayashii]|uniref:Oxidoreductase n=1 Tax=Dictyobacter kobayashii TaxID=2014872 RepID=A0A402AT33_9CHLR|nr:Gfo/Idh/MocA family oxidoreductase [Dictyobacter kobayashii]GCE22286.1 oxidoreductase [Dictyobacter kobayashii]
MANTTRIRIAIVGLGFGEDFVPLYLKHPDVEYVAICDMNEARVAAVGDKFGITRRYTRFEDIIASDEYDAVHILTPVSLHAEHVCAALAAGKHCACAVPMATSIEDIERIIAAQRQAGKNYMMMETSVYTREFLYVKQLRDEGHLGPITFLRGTHIQNLEGYPIYWQGYPPMHYITHALSPLLALAGTNASKVYCLGSGELRPDLRKQYTNPYPIETALFRLQDTQLAAEVTMSFFQMARSYIESFAVYGEQQGFEWEQLENEGPALFTMQPVRPGHHGRVTTATRVHMPDAAEQLPREIARFTQLVPYDESDAQRSFRVGGGHGGAHPYLVHEFVRSIVEGRAPAVDARTAANWTAPGICAHASALRDGELVVIPEFS